MASVDPAEVRPYRYQGKIKFDVPGVNVPIEAGFGSGGAGKGSTPYGDWPITQFVPHTPKYDLEGFALNNIYGRLPDPQASDGQRSDVMLHLDPKGRALDQIKSLGCLSVDPKDWPALRDEIISLQKQGYSLVAHVDQTGQVSIRQADGTTATPVQSASAFADATKAARAPIRDLQKSLAKAGFDPGKVDGIQGPQTTAAVKAFQQANGLKADGIVGPMTSTVLAASSNAPPPLPRVRPSLNASIPSDASFGVRLPPGQHSNFAAPGKFADNPYDAGSVPADPRMLALAAPKLATMDNIGIGPSPSGLARMLKESAPPPVPMPGRPIAATVPPAPPAPVQAPPPQLPAQRPAAPVAPPQQVQLRLPSGKMITPGIYDQGDHSVMVSDAGNGIAKVERIRGPGAIPGLIDPLREMNAPTVAGGMIRKMLPGQLGGDASAFVPTVANNVKSAALGAANNLGSSIGGMFGGLGAMFAPKPATWSPWGSPAFTPQRRPASPMPMSRPTSFYAPQQASRLPSIFAQPAQSRPSVPVQVQQQAVRAQQAQNDLRASGMIDQFGMIP